jgi:hypothetical protein
VGFWAASLTTTFALGWVLSVILADAFAFPRGAWGEVASYAPSLFLAPSYVALMVAIRQYVPIERRIWTSIAVQVATIYAALNATVYFIELTLVIPRKLSDTLGDLGYLQMKPGALLYAVDVFGYLLMSLAAGIAAFAFAGSRTQLERWLFGLLLGNWLIVALGAPIMMFWSQAIPLMLVWAAIWTVTIPIPAILLARLFRREGSAQCDESGE